MDMDFRCLVILQAALLGYGAYALAGPYLRKRFQELGRSASVYVGFGVASVVLAVGQILMAVGAGV